MQTLDQVNERRSILKIQRDINLGGIKTVAQLLKRTGRASLPYSIFDRLLIVLSNKRAK